ncbi:MAG: transposase [Candidatus Tectomicrobia bacterium]|nr:transposase [Candidatus Tectomicrobia bacterium]
MGKYREYSAAFKTERVLEILSGVKTPAEVCREYRIKPSLLGTWRTKLLDGVPSLFLCEAERDPAAARIAELDAAKQASSLLTSHLRRDGGRS